MLFAISSAAGERVTFVDVVLLTTPGAILLVILLDRLVVVLLVMLPVPLLIGLIVILLMGLFVVPLITLPVMLQVPLLFTWLSAPMSRNAIPARTSRDGNRREMYCMPCAPLCKEIV
jgi:hypothetical protein